MKRMKYLLKNKSRKRFFSYKYICILYNITKFKNHKRKYWKSLFTKFSKKFEYLHKIRKM